MKKSLLIALAASLLFAVPTQAKVLVTAGPSYSTEAAQMGYAAGVGVSTRTVFLPAYIQSELRLEQKYSEVEKAGTKSQIDYTSLMLPVTLHFKTPIGWRLYAGIYGEYFMNKSAETVAASPAERSTDSLVDFGYGGIIGLERQLLPFVSLDLRYSFGLTDVDEDKRSLSSSEVKPKTLSLAVLVSL